MSGRNVGGLHVAEPGSQQNMRAFLLGCAEAGYPVAVVKGLSTIGPPALAKEISLKTFTVWRAKVQFGGGDDADNPPLEQNLTQAQIEAMAKRWMSICYIRWRSPIDYLHPESTPIYHYIDAFEITNEGNWQNERDIKNADTFYIACMKDAEAQPEHFKLVLWSFSSGCPEPEHIEWMRPSLRYAYEHGHYLGVHDGSVDSDHRLFGENYNGIPEQGTVLRYRMFYNYFGWCPQVIITECYQPEGYHDPAMYDWEWYLGQLAQDPYVIGCCWFTEGDYNFGGESVNVDRQLVPGFMNACINAAKAAPTPTPSNSTVLDIKYFDQNNKVSANDTSQDCGPACLAMLLASNGLDVTVNEVFRRTKALPGQPITFAQLQTAALTYGYTLEDRRNCTPDDLYALLRDKVAPILLVNARFLNQPGKAVPYTGAHFVVLVGSTADGFLTHDPNNLPNTIQPNLAEAWGNCHLQGNPDFAMLVLREGAIPAPTPIPAPIPIPEPEPGPVPLPVTAFRLGVGMGARAIPTPTEVNAIHIARLDAVKVLTLADPGENAAMIDILRQSLGDIHIMARLFFSVDSENKRKFSPGAFVEYVKGAALALYAEGVQEFEVHNEPNLSYEGWGFNWLDGISFSNWYIEVIGILRGLMPLAQFGFPGASPGDAVINVRQECTSFWNEAHAAIAASDFVCAHSYWQQPHGWWGMDDVTGGMSWRLCPHDGKELVVSEFSNNNRSTTPAVKGTDYILYAQMLQATGLVDAAYCFALSWPGQDLNREGWVVDGRATEIPGIVGVRTLLNCGVGSRST